MKITKKEMIEVDTVEYIICDKCHKKIRPIDENGQITNDIFESEEFLHIKFTGGYGSVFGDGATVECDICPRCLHEIIKDICRIYWW